MYKVFNISFACTFQNWTHSSLTHVVFPPNYLSIGLSSYLAIGLVIFVLYLPDEQVLFFWEIQITEGLKSILLIRKGFGAS